ncbi:MAG TPA: Rieske (2Fe-2S) protein [Rubrobacteraceae bacterium]|nr:Rieske (2Fe-2S) protein [Rubrobacteraceae bacterium]
MTEESLSRKGFIKLGAALGVSTCGTSILAGCGGGGSEAPGKEAVEGGLTGGVEGAAQSIGGGTKEGGTTVAEIGEEEAIARVEDVPPGTAVEFTDAELEQPALLVHLENGGFVAYSAVCTHRQCIVNYRDGKLACPCHGSVYNPAAGAAVEAGPANRPLPEIPVEVQNGQVVRA